MASRSRNRQKPAPRPELTEPRREALPPVVDPSQSGKALLLQALVIVAITFAAHWSSLGNQYALDDQLILQRNVHVLRGIRGIGEIFTTHVYQSYFEGISGEAPPMNRHYRPLAVSTFAIEQSLFGPTLGDEYLAARQEAASPTSDPGVAEKRLVEVERQIDAVNASIAFERHLVQLLLYAGAMVVLLLFLSRCIFPQNPWAAFIATVVFALHPIHTEVVANLKGRDEILSILFLSATGIFVFEWDRTRRPLAMGLAIASITLGLLSKEYAVLAPPILGAALMLVRRRTFRQVLTSTVVPLVVPVALFMMLRQEMLGTAPTAGQAAFDLIVDPFLKIRTGEAQGSIAATKIDMMDQNLRLLFVPHPLAADYSYAAFSYRTFGAWQVWASLLAHAVIAALTLLAWRRRHVLAFAGIVYLGFTILVQIGAVLGDRLAFHPSLGFAVLLGWVIALLPRPAALAVCALIAVPYGVLSYQRDAAWKDDRTLFATDVKTVPDSTLVRAKAGSALLNEGLDRVAQRSRENQPLSPADRQFVRERAAAALVHLRRSVEINPAYAGAWISIGTAHYYREEWGPSGDAFARAAEIDPGHPALSRYAANFHLLGATLAKNGDLAGANEMFGRASAAAPGDLRYQMTYGATALSLLKFAEARKAFERAVEVDSTNGPARQGLTAAIAYDKLTQATVERPNDPQAFEDLAAALERYPQPAFAAEAARMRAKAAELRGG